MNTKGFTTVYQITAKVSDLQLHPALVRVVMVPDVATALGETHHHDPARLERLEDLRADWAAWVDDIRDHGVLEPLSVIAADDDTLLVIDGRHRLAAAQQAGLTEVPCRLVEAEDMNGVIVGSVTGRRHWTKSQRAWFAVLMHPEVAGDVHGKVGGKNRPAENAGLITQPDLAARFGVSERLLRDAIELFRGLEKYPDFRERFEPSLWAGASLAGLLQGFRAVTDIAQSNGPGIPTHRHPPGNIHKAWASEAAHAARWSTLDDDKRTVLQRNYEQALADLPFDYLRWKQALVQVELLKRFHNPKKMKSENGKVK